MNRIPSSGQLNKKQDGNKKISGDPKWLPEIFFGKCMANSTLLSTGQGLRKRPAATLARLPSVC